MKLDLCNLNIELKELLNENNLTITHLFISSKIMQYYYNNDLNINNEELLILVNKLYDLYSKDDSVDIYDELINESSFK